MSSLHSKWTVRRKLLLLSTSLAFTIILISAVAQNQRVIGIRTAQELALVTVPSVKAMADIDMMHDGIRANVLNASLFADGASPSTGDEIRDELKDFEENVMRDFTILEALALPPDIKAKVDDSKPRMIAYLEKAKSFNSDALAGAIKDRKARVVEFEKDFQFLEGYLEKLGNVIEAQAKEVKARSVDAGSSSSLLFFFVIGFGIFMAAAMSIFTISNTMSTITDATQTLVHEAEHIRDLSEKGSGVANELAETVDQQSQRVQRSAATIHEISEMAKVSAENASTVRSMASTSVRVANDGKAQVGEVVKVFGEINRVADNLGKQINQSNEQFAAIVNVIHQISAKTQVINEIVFQTKLLSFNASVEAARAGEHGKGFSVVAEEVGNLARSSGAASEEIATLLSSSTRQVEETLRQSKERTESALRESSNTVSAGFKIAKECDQSLDKVVASAQDVEQRIDQISAAIREQSVGVEDMSQTLQEIETSLQASKQQASLSADTAQGMSSATVSLRNLSSSIMSRFGVKLSQEFQKRETSHRPSIDDSGDEITHEAA